MNQKPEDKEATWQEHIRTAKELDKQFWKRADEVGSPKFVIKQLLKIPFFIMCLITPLTLIWLGDTYLIPFNPESWKAAGQSYAEVEKRHRMVRRLEHQYQLIGMSRTELVKLLGEPKEVRLGWNMAYLLGSGDYLDLEMRSELLVFRLNRGKVTAYDIVRSS